MPQCSTEFQRLSPELFAWHYYDPSLKVELWSTAIALPTGLYFIDPIPLAGPALAELCQERSAAGVVVTNANHSRASLEYAVKFSVPVFNGPNATGRITADLATIAIDGAAVDEIAVFHPASGTLIVGDALINFEPQGLSFLPKKYCRNEKQMRRALRQLLNLKIDRIFFAHGQPILFKAAQKLEALLES